MNTDEHLAKARRNERFLEAINEVQPPYHEWVVVVAFYAAVHYVDAFFALRDTHPETHTLPQRSQIGAGQQPMPLARNYLVSILLSPIQHKYSWLYDMSIQARYGMPTLAPRAARQAVQELGHIQQYVQNQLRRQRSP